MTATTTTTITGVSIFTRKRRRKADLFDIVLSHDGIEIRRRGHGAQRMAWSRVSQWEVEQRLGDVVLTLRGDGAITPLLVKGWTADDLVALLRAVTAGSTPPRGDGAAAFTVSTTVAATQPATESATGVEAPAAAPRPAPRAERRRALRRARRERSVWTVAATVTLLLALAAAVTMVLLQSAGIISWGFLGPTA